MHHGDLRRRRDELTGIVEQFTALVEQTVSDDDCPLTRAQPLAHGHAVHERRELQRGHPARGAKWQGRRGQGVTGEEQTPRIPRRLTVVQSKPSDRKSTRLNSSHLGISYAVFCL